MELQPRLLEVSRPREPAGVVIVMHGGAARRSSMMVSPTQLSVLRMVPIARRIARAGRGHLAVFRLLNSVRGWDTHHTPVKDAHWALDQVAEQLEGTRPACLVGHSLGGRAAVFAASDRAEVRSVVALAPYFTAGDRPASLGDRETLFVHGDGDRIASPGRAASVAAGLGARFVAVEGGKHAMLRRHSEFSRPAAEWAVRTVGMAETSQ